MPPTAPDRRKLPLVQDAYRVFDVRMDVLVTEARRLGHSVPCKLGCDACCYDVTYAIPRPSFCPPSSASGA